MENKTTNNGSGIPVEADPTFGFFNEGNKGTIVIGTIFKAQDMLLF